MMRRHDGDDDDDDKDTNNDPLRLLFSIFPLFWIDLPDQHTDRQSGL